jgi:hypothetical protein
MRSRRFGTAFRPPSTSTAICWRMHPSDCTRRLSADYSDMIHAATREEIERRRKAFIRKWRVKHRAVADGLQEAGDRLFTFARLPPSQWANAIERLHEEFKRRIKTRTVLPSADTAAMLFWASRFPARSACVRSMAGRRSPPSPSISRLISPRDPDHPTGALRYRTPSRKTHQRAS